MENSILGKVGNFIKGKGLGVKAKTIIEKEFIHSDINSLNLKLKPFGISLGERENVSVLNFIQLEGLKKGVEFSKPIPLFNVKSNESCVIHINPSAICDFTIKDVSGNVVRVISSNATSINNIIRIQGSKEMFTIEGAENV